MNNRKKLQLAWIIIGSVMILAMLLFTILPSLY